MTVEEKKQKLLELYMHPTLGQTPIQLHFLRRNIEILEMEIYNEEKEPIVLVKDLKSHLLEVKAEIQTEMESEDYEGYEAAIHESLSDFCDILLTKFCTEAK